MLVLHQILHVLDVVSIEYRWEHEYMQHTHTAVVLAYTCAHAHKCTCTDPSLHVLFGLGNVKQNAEILSITVINLLMGKVVLLV